MPNYALKKYSGRKGEKVRERARKGERGRERERERGEREKVVRVF